MPSSSNPRSVNHAQDAEVVRGTPRPVIVGSGDIWASPPRDYWASQPRPVTRLHHYSGHSGGSQHNRNTQKHQPAHRKWRVAAIAVSSSGFIIGIITVIEAVKR